MKITVSQRSDTPIYEQIYQQLASEIMNGALLPDFCLPSIRMIAKELGISVITVKNAYDMLERDGFIYTKAAVGCFVNPLAHRDREQKRLETAAARISKDIEYYKVLGLSKEEVLKMMEELYK